MQSITPEGAALGVVAAGLIGYAIADDDDGHYRHKKGYRAHPQYGRYGHPHGGYGGYGRGGSYCRY